MPRKVNINRYISSEPRDKIKAEIAENDGNEVFFKGKTDDSGIVTEVTALSWGNENSTPALLQDLAPGNVVIHNHPSGMLTPSNQDVQIASMLGNQGVGFYIVNNTAKELNVIVERHVFPDLHFIDTAKMASMLDEDSKISRELEDYEPRPGQMQMASAAARCFNDSLVAMIEGGTGTGKTLAYMLPAIEWAVTNKERILISTKTINLQEQLVGKDLPFLKKVAGHEFRTVLVKGRGNYCCLRKAESEARDLGFFKDDDDFNEISSLIAWSKETGDGSLSDLSYIPKHEVWDRIKCESDTCTGVKCEFYEDCFLVSARREASRANILIVNHHLLFADLALRGSLGSLADIAVLPPYTRVIVDEAHHIEDVSTEYFGSQFTEMGTKRLFSKLASISKKGDRKGLLPRLSAKIRNLKKNKITEVLESIRDRIERDLIIQKMELVEFIADIFLDVKNVVNRIKDKFPDSNQFMLDHRFFEDDEWNNIVHVKAGNWINRIRDYTSVLNSITEDLKDLEELNKTGLENETIELDSMVRRLTGAADALNYLLYETDKTMVKWIEISDNNRSVKISSAPVEVGEYLVNSLFNPFDTVIMTSATLAVKDSFDFIKSRLGLEQLDQHRFYAEQFPSPFDFKNQVLIGVPINNHPPDHPGFLDSAKKLITDSINISQGKAFVLFTSYRSLQYAYDYASNTLNGTGIKLLKQGTDTRSTLIKQFKQEKAAALFATDSFWEGVDVIGDDLESIIIARLPFKVPTAPIEIARREAIENEGRNSFMEYTVPQAIIKFKQGFGRLIRHKNDRGTILVLDNRIISKFYGKMFLESLPDCGRIIGRADEVFQEFREFYDREIN